MRAALLVVTLLTICPWAVAGDELWRAGEYSVPAILEKLRTTESDAERSHLQGTLRSLGAAAAPYLVEELRSKSRPDRDRALRYLARAGPQEVLAPEIARILEDVTEGPLTRALAAEALCGMDAGIDALLRSLDSPIEDVYIAAEISIERMAPKSDRLLARLLGALSGDDRRSRDIALDVLPRYGARAEAAVPAILADFELHGSQYWPRAREIQALAKMGEAGFAAAEPMLVEALSDTTPAWAARALAEHPPVSEKVIEVLFKEVISERGWVDYGVAQALRGAGRAEEVVSVLIEALESGSGRAADILGEMGEAARPAIPALTAALDSPLSWIRLAAATALGRLGEDPGPLFRVLARVRMGHNEYESREAISALGYLGPPAYEWIEEALGDADEEVYRPAVSALGTLAEESPIARARLVSLLLDERRMVGSVVAGILARFGPEIVPLILPNLDGKSPSGAYNAILALFYMNPPPSADTVPALIRVLGRGGEDWLRCRWLAVRTLGRIGPGASEAAPVLAGLLQSDDYWTREHALEALIRIGPAALAAKDEVARLLSAAGPRTRALAAITLGAIGAVEEELLAPLLEDRFVYVRKCAALVLANR